MNSRRVFLAGTAVFWLAVLALVALDAISTDGIRAEPPPIALGSGQAASGGHCSGR